MHLMEILELRPVPASAAFFALTRRCPLSCAHCSTNSMLASGEWPAEMFVRFADTFTPESRPELIAMSGGEPMLRPQLVVDLADRIHAAGGRAQVLSGLFFARSRRIPVPILRAIDAVDHFSASLDWFHEQEVSRPAVFRVLDEVLARGKSVSLQIVGLGEDDPYLAAVTEDVLEHFGDDVPMLVGGVGAVGRAADWLPAEDTSTSGAEPAPDPCTLVNWPLVGFDGTIVACCNQLVVDGPAPEHLRLGHAAHDDWASVRERYLSSALLRGIRLYGPTYLAARHGASACDGYCETCFALPGDERVAAGTAAMFARPTARIVEREAVALQQREGALAFARRFGLRRYADLIALGSAGTKEPECVA